MEQSVDTETSTVSTTDNKQKGGNGMKIVTAIACVAAVCGIVFGVYGIMQGLQKDNQTPSLKIQIKDDDGTITAIETPDVETTTDGETIVTMVMQSIRIAKVIAMISMWLG